jgi:hypothetical protein
MEHATEAWFGKYLIAIEEGEDRVLDELINHRMGREHGRHEIHDCQIVKSPNELCAVCARCEHTCSIWSSYNFWHHADTLYLPSI